MCDCQRGEIIRQLRNASQWEAVITYNSDTYSPLTVDVDGAVSTPKADRPVLTNFQPSARRDGSVE